MTKHLKQPCAACPFSRNVVPGALGGSPPETFIGQAQGPFVLPCHKACDFTDPEWKQKAFDTPQCAGAAIYRANIGVADHLPDALHKLPADTVAVFRDASEFLAHHKQVDLVTAKLALAIRTPHDMMLEQIQRLDNYYKAGRKAGKAPGK